jgi:hypothetical protein
MHKLQGCVVICTILYFYIFQVLYSIAHVVIRGLYIGFINLWVSVVGQICRTLEMFYLVPFCRINIISHVMISKLAYRLYFFLHVFFIIHFLVHFSLGSTPLSRNMSPSLLFRSVVIHEVEPTIHGFPS